jgi:hypothetical protein
MRCMRVVVVLVVGFCACTTEDAAGPDAGDVATDAEVAPGGDAASSDARPADAAPDDATEAPDACSDVCIEHDMRCASDSALETCARGSTGCTMWKVAAACPAHEVCSGGQCAPSCTDECVLGQQVCDGGGVTTCVGQPTGCRGWSDPVPCDRGSTCSNGQCMAVCSDACTEGATRCAPGGIETCAIDVTGCTAWSATATCGPQRLCVGTTCTAFVDGDHDGYFAADDCDDESADASPTAPEIPGDAIDQNCNLAVDEACGGAVICSHLHAPTDLVATPDAFGHNTVTGRAAPGSTILAWNAYAESPSVLSVPVDAAGTFQLVGRQQGEMLVLQNVAAGEAPGGRVWLLLPGNPAFNRVPAPTGVAISAIDDNHASVSASSVLRAVLSVENRSAPAWVRGEPLDGDGLQLLSPASGFAPTMSGTIHASGGDVLVVRADGLDGALGSHAAPMRMPGLDVTPPIAPRVAGGPWNPGFKIAIATEGLAVASIVDTASGIAFVESADARGNILVAPAPAQAGDPIVVRVSDGTHDSPMAMAVIEGSDVTPPRAPASLVVTPSRAGAITVSGRVEIGATVVVDATTLPSVWSGADAFATFHGVVTAVPGDRISIHVRDAAGLDSVPMTIYVTADSGVPPAPSEVTGSMNAGWHVSGYAQPGTTLHIHDSSAGAEAAAVLISDPGGAFDVNLLWWSTGGIVRGGDTLVLWSDAPGGATSTRVLSSVLGNDDRRPLPPTDIVASGAGSLVLVGGRAEIGCTVHVANQSRSGQRGSGPTVFHPSGTDPRATFSVAVAAQSGDRLSITVVDATGNTSPAVEVAAP